MTTSYSNRPPPVTKKVVSVFDKAAYSAYESVKADRDATKEAEHVYKRRVDSLETEVKELLKSYQSVYAENKILRSKVEHGPDAQRIRAFREEIKKQEDKAMSMKTQNTMLTDEVTNLKKQLMQVSDEKKRLENSYKMERGLHVDKTDSVEKEKKLLQETVERLERQHAEYESRILNYEKESDGLINKYKSVKRDNWKMETKYRKQKELIEEEVSDTKHENKAMAKELIQLKMKLSKLQSEYESLKLDLEASQKQIEYQQKELDVYKEQTAVFKRDALQKSRQQALVENELKTVENMLDDERNFGFEGALQERNLIRHREEKLLKKIDRLEMQIEELSEANATLEKDVDRYKIKMEAAIMDHQNIAMAEASYKRRIQALENANIELDRNSRFSLEKIERSNGVVVTMGNDNIKTVEKEKRALLNKLKALEIQNRRMERKIKELENGNGDSLYSGDDESFTVHSTKSKGNSSRLIRAEMAHFPPVVDPGSYRKKLNRSSLSSRN